MRIAATDDDDLTKQAKLVLDAKTYLIDELKKIESQLKSRYDVASGILVKWRPIFEDVRSKYDKLIAEHGGDKQKQERLRRQLEEQKAELELTAQSYRDIVQDLNKVKTRREELLTQLEYSYQQYYNVRKGKFDDLTHLSDGKLQLVLEHAANKEIYTKQLIELLKGGTAPSVAQRRQIANKVSARRLVDLVLSRNYKLLSKETELTEVWTQRIIEKLWSHNNFSEVLALQHSFYPEDIPYIRFRKAEGIYAELNELSVGQKCTALLIVALAEGNIPIIIDQPEDAIDIVSVWEDIAKKLIDRKVSRQFVLTTHNSSVAVAADSDQFIVCKLGLKPPPLGGCFKPHNGVQVG